MKRVGVIGLGDMGSGLAKNLVQAGFATSGFDLSEQRMRAFAEMGGQPAEHCAQVGENADVVFVMVMNGAQVTEVVFGEQGLVSTLAPGSVLILTATIKPAEARELAHKLENTGIALIDSPVSGGFPGAQSGTLTMMAAGAAEVLDDCRAAMEAVSKTIHRVGDSPGMGQTVKACLQSLIGSIFSATFEASVLAAKAGVEGQVLFDVFSTSGAGCGITNTALEHIVDRRFADTGSHIATMYKDLTIALDMARELGVPLFTASTAMQLFQAGKTRHPEGDNWVVTRVLEEIVGSRLNR
ncbi:MAG: NAD(P)-dependent oxidoreductase [Gammaproteobacteria bacterium]|nr:NAD(P)-dependent oxidoreductase [Gammaproteobacteria bacterium]